MSVVGVGASLWGVRSDMVTQLIAATTITTTMAALSKETDAVQNNENSSPTNSLLRYKGGRKTKEEARDAQ